MEVTRLDRESGKRTPWMSLSVPDPAGVSVKNLLLTPDARSYAYTYSRRLDDLYLAKGLK
jgi:hypothetical protein